MPTGVCTALIPFGMMLNPVWGTRFLVVRVSFIVFLGFIYDLVRVIEQWGRGRLFGDVGVDYGTALKRTDRRTLLVTRR